MKKIIFSIICFFSISLTSNAFFGEPTSIDLYKNIDRGIYELEEKMIGFELSGAERKTGVIKEVNQYAVYHELPACLDEGMEMSPGRLIQIARDESILDLKEFISEECKTGPEKEDQLVDLLSQYIAIIKSYLEESTYVAEQKTKRIYQTSSVGMYGDGIAENSPFDLITDLQDIDKIIFNQVEEYENEEHIDIEEEIEKLTEGIDYEVPEMGEAPKSEGGTNLGGGSSNNSSGISSSGGGDNSNGGISKIGNQNNVNNNNSSNIYTTNNYVCSEEINNTGLNNNELNTIINSINTSNNQNNNNSNGTTNNSNNGESSSSESGGGEYEGAEIEVESSISDYEKVTDNSVWPCEDIFCININFKMYEQNVFGGGGGSSNMTIEYLIKRSNEHLGVFDGTSLTPATMTTNQFQLNLENLSLPDILDIDVIIYKKPLPILDIEEPGEKDETEYSGKNLTKRFYEAKGLDYKRRNDLTLLRKEENNKQVINNSVGLSNEQVIKNIGKYETYFSKNDESDTITKIVEKKAGYGITENFKEHFREIDKFSEGIVRYIEDLMIKIEEIEKIPIDTA